MDGGSFPTDGDVKQHFKVDGCLLPTSRQL